jgi:hypothetical protein
MEFVLAIFFLLFYYLRPQDWVAGLEGANLIKPIMAIWAGILLTARSRLSPLHGWMRTPHDWVILIYYAYVVVTAPDPNVVLTGFLPLVVFYAFTVQSVNTWERLLSYLKWWNLALALVALLAVMSLFGIDPTGAKEATDRMVGRLCIGTWLHDNPNALGHSVVVVIPLSYFLFFWKGTATGRFFIFPAFAALAYYAVFRTESKGSFLVGGLLFALLFVIGRPKIVQVLAISAAFTMGISALSFLPRMSQMSDLSSDEGVQGRLMAWEMARTASQAHATGEGWGQFQAYIDWREGDRIIYAIPKATHSSYVQVAADLGIYGLFVYLACIWTALHTLMAFRPKNEIEDRCRRALLILIVANLVSGWMINRQYHTEYFLMIAATAALHRLRKGEEIATAEAEEKSPETAEILGSARPAAALVPAFIALRTQQVVVAVKRFWNKIGVFDVAVSVAMTWMTLYIWDYILETM